MSVFREREVTCGACGARHTHPVALSIHGSRAPELLEQIRQGSFNRFPCASCTAVTLVDGPLLVIDFEHPWWVQMYPRAWTGAWQALEADAQRRFHQTLVEHAPAFVREQAPAFIARMTFGMDGVREKLLLRDAGIDDVTVELVKLLVVARRDDGQVPGLRVDAITDEAAILVGAPEGPIEVLRARLPTIADDASLAPTRALLTAGMFVDALRISEPGDAPMPHA